MTDVQAGGKAAAPIPSPRAPRLRPVIRSGAPGEQRTNQMRKYKNNPVYAAAYDSYKATLATFKTAQAALAADPGDAEVKAEYDAAEKAWKAAGKTYNAATRGLPKTR